MGMWVDMGVWVGCSELGVGDMGRGCGRGGGGCGVVTWKRDRWGGGTFCVLGEQ